MEKRNYTHIQALLPEIKAMLAEGKTQREVAEYLQVAQNTYCNYENGVREIPIELLIRLSRFYKVNVEYLLGLTDQAAMLPPSKTFHSRHSILSKEPKK